jgi:ribulose-phosphate 3-epimerase
MIYVSPSLLSSDFSRLGEEAAVCRNAGADMIHIDVMDGHFVPNITLGAPIVKSLRKCSDLCFDVHLMISDPIKYIPDFIKAGADIITVHAESDGSTEEAVDMINAAGIKAGVAIKPKTPASEVFPYLDKLSMVLVMTVEPGFGGQSFMTDMMPKIREIRAEAEKRGLSFDIEVDGGITDKTLPVAYEAGANVFVAGSYFFGASDRKAAVDAMRHSAE